MQSEIKIGQQFEFAIHADKEFRQKAVVPEFYPIEKKESGRRQTITSPLGLKREHSRNRQRRSYLCLQTTKPFIWMACGST